MLATSRSKRVVPAGASKQRSQKERPNANSRSPVRQLPEPEIRQKHVSQRNIVPLEQRSGQARAGAA